MAELVLEECGSVYGDIIVAPSSPQKNDRGGFSVYIRSRRLKEDSAMHCIGCGDDIYKIPSKRGSLCSDSVGDSRATKADFIVAT